MEHELFLCPILYDTVVPDEQSECPGQCQGPPCLGAVEDCLARAASHRRGRISQKVDHFPFFW